MSRNRIAGIVLISAIAVLGAVFGVFNWLGLEQRKMLERDGVVAIAHIDAVTISHNACNSSAHLSWADQTGAPHTGRFTTCFANRTAGETVTVRYLKTNPEIAMIAPGEGGLPDSHYRNGAVIGIVMALVMTAVAGKLIAGWRQSRRD